jgi:hypothetical protein
MRSGEDFAAFAKFLEMRDQSLTEIVFRFAPSPAVGDRAGHVRRISQIAGAGFLNDDEIFFHDAADTRDPSGANIPTDLHDDLPQRRQGRPVTQRVKSAVADSQNTGRKTGRYSSERNLSCRD